MKNYFINFTIVLIALFIAATIGEIFLRIFWESVPPRVDSRTMGGMSLPGWPDFLRFVPDTKTIAVSPTAEFAVHYKINSFGMRDREHSKRRNVNTCRILFVGDSFTEGYGVEQHEAYPSHIEYLSQGVLESLNAGMRGICPSFAFFRLQRFIDFGLEFDAVVYQVFDNDFYDDAVYTDLVQLRSDPVECIVRGPFYKADRVFRFLGPFAWPLSHLKLSWLFATAFLNTPAGSAETRVYPVSITQKIMDIYKSDGVEGVRVQRIADGKNEIVFPTLSKKMLCTNKVNELWRLLRDINFEVNPKNTKEVPLLTSPAEYPDDVKRSLHYLDCLATLCSNRNIPLYIVYQPGMPLISRQNEYYFKSWCIEKGIPFLSMREDLRTISMKSEKAIFFPIDGHLAPEGHRLVAKMIFKWLKSLLPLYSTTSKQ